MTRFIALLSGLVSSLAIAGTEPAVIFEGTYQKVSTADAQCPTVLSLLVLQGENPAYGVELESTPYRGGLPVSLRARQGHRVTSDGNGGTFDAFTSVNVVGKRVEISVQHVYSVDEAVVTYRVVADTESLQFDMRSNGSTELLSCSYVAASISDLE